MTLTPEQPQVDGQPNGDDASVIAAGPGTVISFHYDLYDKNATRIESSRNTNPVLCLYGENGVLLALQDAFTGKMAGEDFSITITHQKAYGRHYPERVQRISRKKIDAGKKQTFRVGQIITLRGEQGPSPATIIKVGKFNLDVDTNHPLAGVDLTFDVSIEAIRVATDEERAHGHAHGVGGHQH